MSKLDLRLGDSVEVLKTLEDESVDLVVTSPPYDNLRNYEGTLKWNFEVFTQIADELARVLKKGGVIVWVVGDATIKGSETGSSFRQALYFKDACRLNLHDTMIWEKTGQGALGSILCYGQNFEYMFVLSKGKPKSINLIKDRENVVKSGTVKVNSGINPDKVSKNRVISRKPFGKRHNLWKIEPQRGSEHPAPFPVILAEDHIKSWSEEGDLILDPFMGSGTTGEACKNLSRNFIGIEKVEEYYNMSKERLEQKIDNQ